MDPVLLISVVVAGIGALILPASPTLAVALIALSAFRILGRLWIVWRRRRAAAPALELFLDPRIAKVDVVETLTGSWTLGTDRNETSSVDRITGRIAVEAVWTRANHAHARKRMNQIGGEGRHLRAAAGTLVLTGEGQLTLRPNGGVVVTHPSAVQLRPRLGDHEVLTAPDGRGDPRWRFAIPYDPNPSDSGRDIPVWITPSFVPDSDRKALELRVQWRTRKPDDDIAPDRELLAKELTSVEIWVPASWGEVTRVEDANAEQCTVANVDEATPLRRIVWRKPEVPSTGRGVCRLAVAFDQRIDVESRITGKIIMKFDRTLSGATGVDVYSSGGAPRRWQEIPGDTRTDLEISFEISLAAVRYQGMVAIPERGDDTAGQSEHQGVVPDHNTIGKLVEQLSNDRYYVKSLVENPPRPGSIAPIVNRVWDISGRRYQGLHPTDFRILITGEEPETGAANEGSTRVRLSVKGAYASPETKRRIEQEYEKLRERIDAVLSRRAAADKQFFRPRNHHTSRTLINVLYSVQEMLAESKRSGDVPSSVADRIIDHIDTELRGG